MRDRGAISARHIPLEEDRIHGNAEDSRIADLAGRTTADLFGSGSRDVDVSRVHTRGPPCSRESGHVARGRSRIGALAFRDSLNLVAYSWFYYPFNVTAQFLAYVSLENALRLRFATGTRGSFKKLVGRAVRKGLVKDQGFSAYREPEDLNGYPPELRSMFSEPVPNAYVDALTESIPSLRNSLAHGSSMLHMHGLQAVRLCAEFINQLFVKEPHSNEPPGRAS